jgi:hypothetical protein
MKKLTGIAVIFFFALGLSANAKAASMPIETNPTNDTTVAVKSNVVLFKLIATPIASTTTNNSGSLKNAGKVARTSYSHCTSIENIIYKKKGI